MDLQRESLVVELVLVIDLPSGQGPRASLLVHLVVSVLYCSMILGGLLTAVPGSTVVTLTLQPLLASLLAGGIGRGAVWCGGGAPLG